jgi:hypothetical protein
MCANSCRWQGAKRVSGGFSSSSWKIVDLGADIDRPVREASDFLIVGHQLEFVGICPQCQRPSTELPNAAALAPTG